MYIDANWYNPFHELIRFLHSLEVWSTNSHSTEPTTATSGTNVRDESGIQLPIHFWHTHFARNHHLAPQSSMLSSSPWFGGLLSSSCGLPSRSFPLTRWDWLLHSQSTYSMRHITWLLVVSLLRSRTTSSWPEFSCTAIPSTQPILTPGFGRYSRRHWDGGFKLQSVTIVLRDGNLRCLILFSMQLWWLLSSHGMKCSSSSVLNAISNNSWMQLLRRTSWLWIALERPIDFKSSQLTWEM